MQNYKHEKMPIDDSRESLLTLEEYENMQIEEALGSTNMWLAGKELKHKPTEDEAVMYYCEYGGADDFRRRYGHRLKGR